MITTTRTTFIIPLECTMLASYPMLLIRDANGNTVLDAGDRFYKKTHNGEDVYKCTVSINLPNGDYEWNIRMYLRGEIKIQQNAWRPITLKVPQQWYRDGDGDGYGDNASPHSTLEIDQPPGYVWDNTDCDDTNSKVYPGAEEFCGDDLDNDCDGGDAPCETDEDGDGWRSDAGDCDDTNPNIHPRAADKCNDGIDQDCFGGDLECSETKCSKISDTPVVSGFAPPPNLMILWDNSGSMDYSVATNEDDEGRLNGYSYVFDIPDNLFEEEFIAEGQARNTWKGRYYGHNKLYYNPHIDYEPWPDTNQYQDLKAFKDHTATNPRYARSHPLHNEAATLDLNGIYHDGLLSGTDIRNAHYFYKSGDYVYLVQMYNGNITYHRFSANQATYYVREYDWDKREFTYVWPEEVNADQVPDAIKSRTYAQERQNFANWFTFHRKRHYAALVSITQMLRQLNGFRVGIRGVNPTNSLNHGVLPIEVDGQNKINTLLNGLYNLEIDFGGSNLRQALWDVGNYFDDHDGNSVYYTEEAGGTCQHSFALIVTDGHWNDEFSGVGDTDGDGHANTLADVAMAFYKNDISTLPNKMPITETNTLDHQHMITYAITINQTGRLNPATYSNCPEKCESIYPAKPHCSHCPDWPEVTEDSSSGYKVDDLWHAVVNTRGQLYSVDDPQTLTKAFKSAAASIDSRIRSSSALTLNTGSPKASTAFYQATYSTENWTGDLRARSIDVSTGQIGTTILWSAADILGGNLSQSGWLTSGTGRKIFTAQDNGGLPFTDDNAEALGLSPNVINYIRGDDSLEGNGATDFRQRAKPLGDIVGSAPHFVNNTVFVGANDGMLHAFNAATGGERFAFIPSFVLPNLEELTHQKYPHYYYVDRTPSSKTIDDQTTYLVGGLGKGGKGYYCLDISTAQINPASETHAASNIFKWEFPQSTDNDMGYSYSQAHIVKTQAGWAVIFGNGYESVKGKAVLYVVKLSDGSLIRKINTKAGNPNSNCNGLSSPSPIDVNGDGIVDYVYAGDLLGNMWKFDLTHENPNQWDIFFQSSSGWPQPLFKAMNKNGHVQPITTKPDVITHCDRGKSGYIVIFGTGILLGKKDAVNSSTQTIYGIWDWSEEWVKNGESTAEKNTSDKYLGKFLPPDTNGLRKLGHIRNRSYLSSKAKYVTLIEQTEVHSNNSSIRVLSDNKVNWYSREEDSSSRYHLGWYFDLPQSRERLVQNVITRSGALILVSTIPVTHPCDLTNRSYLMEMNPCSGGRTNGIYLDINDDGELNEKDAVLVDTPGQNGKRHWVPATGISFDQAVSLPTILPLEENKLEIKYFSASDGSITTVNEAPEKLGVFYWREKEQ